MIAREKTGRPPTLLGHYAGFVSRLFAFILDTLVLSIALIASAWFTNASMKMLGINQLLKLLGNTAPILQTIVDFLYSKYFTGLVTLLIVVSYHLFFWTFAGQTIGKAIFGIKIVPLKGGKMSLGRSIKRYLGYFLSAFPLGLGFLWILVNDKRMAWHDHLARTCVVYAWDARPDETFLVETMRKIETQRKAVKTFVDKLKTNQSTK